MFMDTIMYGGTHLICHTGLGIHIMAYYPFWHILPNLTSIYSVCMYIRTYIGTYTILTNLFHIHTYIRMCIRMYIFVME